MLAYGEEGLCEVLEIKDGDMDLRANLTKKNRWIEGLLVEMSQKESLWYALYRKGLMHHWVVWLSKVTWRKGLTEEQKELILRDALLDSMVSAGSFWMGEDAYWINNSSPRHRVTLTKSICVGNYPCAQVLYHHITGTKPTRAILAPVCGVSWCDAVLFCNKLSEREGFEPCYVLPEPFVNSNEWAQKVQWNRAANGYRLPTEAEWEYCAKGGEEYVYSGSDDVDDVAWVRGNVSHIQIVGEKAPNGFGLYDMSGNVWEWCWDAYEKTAYHRGDVCNPVVEKNHAKRVIRGGSALNVKKFARVCERSSLDASYRDKSLGFRMVRTLVHER